MITITDGSENTLPVLDPHRKLVADIGEKAGRSGGSHGEVHGGGGYDDDEAVVWKLRD